MLLLKTINDYLQLLTGRRCVRWPPELIDYLLCLRDSKDSDVKTAWQKFLLAHWESSDAQLFQDLWVLFETSAKEGGYFVEFGAFDGITLSNTLLLERAYGWTGVLAEPNPAMHDLIHQARKCNLDTRCVWRNTGESISFIAAEKAELSTITAYSQIDHHSNDRKKGSIIDVGTVTLHELLDDHNAPEVIDYLSIDTEGSECEILDAFNWGRHIRVMTIEHNFTEQEERIRSLLVPRGYIQRFPQSSKWDSWWIHRDDVIFY